MTIKDVFDQIKRQTPVQVVVGKVQSVDKKAFSCDLVIEAGADRPQARIRSVMDSKDTGMMLIPKKDSYVLVALIDNKPESSFICGYSEIDEVYVKIPQSEMRIDKEGFLMKRSSNNLGGLIGELIDAITQITVTTGTGPSGTPINAPSFEAVKQKFSQLLKTS